MSAAYPLLFRGRPCRIFEGEPVAGCTCPACEVPAGYVTVQFEEGQHVAIAARAEVVAPDRPKHLGPDV